MDSKEAQKLTKRGTILLIVGTIIWFVETWWFGWNLYPHSQHEYLWDTFAGLLQACGIGFLWKGFLWQFANKLDSTRYYRWLEKTSSDNREP